MKTIFYSEKQNISYNLREVKINTENVECIEGPIEDYALKKMREAYATILSRQYENIVVLSGSGTSVGIGNGVQVGKTMSELWADVVKQIVFSELNKFAEKIKFVDIKEDFTDLEALLSKAIISQTYLEDTAIENMIKKIKKVIRDACNLDLPENAPHMVFLRKLTARKLKYSRVKIFTLNYDLLFEKAASKGGYVIIDGFSFSYPRLFNGVNFDYDIVSRNIERAQNEENYISKVFHLYKPHGSLDWDMGENDQVVKSDNPKEPLMIYPSNTKYEYSFEQPYFEMVSRFQQNLRKKNTLLLTIGFSFYDKHIKAMVFEALNVNPSITIVVVSPSVQENDTYLELKEKTEHMSNIHIVNETFENFIKYYPYSDIYENEVIKHESF